MALKKAELSDEVIVRLVEMDGRRAASVRIAFPSPVVAAREVNGQEQPVGTANVVNGELATSFEPYQPRTFAIKLAPSRVRLPQISSQPVPLDYEMSVASRMNRPADGAFDWAPATEPNAVLAHGQTINLPAGSFNRIYLLAAAANADQRATFRIGSKSTDLTIQEWTGFVGQWDDRIWRTTEEPIPLRPNAPPGTPVRTRTNVYGEMIGLRPGFIKRADIAWF